MVAAIREDGRTVASLVDRDADRNTINEELEKLKQQTDQRAERLASDLLASIEAHVAALDERIGGSRG